MGLRQQCKRVLFRSLTTGGVDSVYRYVNRKKLLVVMYHGVTRRDYAPPIWTNLPLDAFHSQLQFLKKNYHIVTLTQVINSIQKNLKLPDNAALITFDDGLKNNYSNAFPLLLEYSVPATIFMVTDYINTDKILWFDELYLLLRTSFDQGCNRALIQSMCSAPAYDNQNLSNIYHTISARFKRYSTAQRLELLGQLRKDLSIELSDFVADFGFIGWDSAREMAATGLIEFGVHTSNHRILANLSADELVSEIRDSKKTLEKQLATEVKAFAYPNGIPGLDFDRHHEIFLKASGFQCAFSTELSLHCLDKGNAYSIGRIGVGSDMTSNPDYFALNTAGVLSHLKKKSSSLRTCL